MVSTEKQTEALTKVLVGNMMKLVEKGNKDGLTLPEKEELSIYVNIYNEMMPKSAKISFKILEDL